MKKKIHIGLILIILWVLFSILMIAANFKNYSPTDFVIVFGVMLCPVIIYVLYRLTKRSKSKKDDSEIVKKSTISKEKTQSICGYLISGLDVPERSFVQVIASPDNIKLNVVMNAGKAYTKEFNLSLSKINHIHIMSEQEIKQVVEQSATGMILGAAAFGIIGAMVGGRVKTKDKKVLKQILIIDYTSTNKNQIVLDCSDQPMMTINSFMKYINKIIPGNIDTTPVDL